jgi:hypothetical protein
MKNAECLHSAFGIWHLAFCIRHSAFETPSRLNLPIVSVV